ncbi:3'-5' DNA helicase [Puttea exsequens]|nr:3'-5' DNA helicase [Puttea exsequens]
MGSQDFNDSDEDELAAAHSQSSGLRPTKRRKLTSPDPGYRNNKVNWAEVGRSSPANAVLNQKHPDNGKGGERDSEEAKTKSKYKIHIPKNGELPTDAFFTQPPQRDSSPYRIGQFYWRKQRRPSPPCNELEVSQHRQPPDAHSFTTSTSRRPSGESTAMLKLRPAINAANHTMDETDEFDLDESYKHLLADLPTSAFTAPQGCTEGNAEEPIFTSSQQNSSLLGMQQHRLAAPLSNLKQTTLFGTQAPEGPNQSQSAWKRQWPLANREEPPTHHKLNHQALETWVYPTNLGTIRDYQYSIVVKGLYHNMLVALPTGLGKTFIAATIMLNWFRWTEDAQIVFVAPTKPLVSQQVKACFDIAGIPRSATTMLTGGISPGLRAEEWQSKRVFFMTPQTLLNDLKTGICDPKRLVLLVVDEAHRATGGYAYVEVVKFLRRFNTSFRVLALTATPGSSIEGVQEVIDGLGISRIEIRTEESLDIRQYVHSRKIDTILFENSDEMVMIMELFSRALQPVLDKLNSLNAYWVKDPMILTPYGCNQARQKWMMSDAGRKAPMAVKGMGNAIFSLLATLSHATELLKFHGIGPFYHKVLAFRNEIHNNGKKGTKYSNQINECEAFQTLMSRVQIWINNPDFVGHPKLEYIQSVIMNHFLDAGDGRGASDPSSTRVMVFSHYRDSAEEISRVLMRNEPMIRPHVFVGQANSKGSEGMDQKTQLETIKNFQTGIYNTLVATSIGEEGLDIGEVDLIICYDASASPIRMLQRMGRTGRKRAGNIVVTLMKGKEETNFIKAKDNYEKMQNEIAAGTRFNYQDEESRRIVPRNTQPVVDKRVIEIPLENTQAELPEPTRRGRPPKRPPKKFRMPDGVRTGFTKASQLGVEEVDSEGGGKRRTARGQRPKKSISPERIPLLDEILLTASQEREFDRKYLDIKGDEPQFVLPPRLDAFPSLQRSLRPVQNIGHSQAAKRYSKMLQYIHSIPYDVDLRFEAVLSSQDRANGERQAWRRIDFLERLTQYSSSSHTLIDDAAPSSVEQSHPGQITYKPFIGDDGLTNISDDECEDDDVSDLIKDEVETEDGEGHASSKSSPPSLAKPTKPFYQSQQKSPERQSVSGDELPDLGALLEGVGAISASAASKQSGRKAGAREDWRRNSRTIIQDDSDDE